MARSLMGKTTRLVVRGGGRMKVHIKKNDNVLVISGKDKGKIARVLAVEPERGRAFVEGVHFVKRHTRPNPSRNIKGGIAEKEGPIHVSNLKVVCPECKAPTRVARTILEDGSKIRSCKKCQGSIDTAK